MSIPKSHERSLTDDDAVRLRQISKELYSCKNKTGLIPDQVERDARFLEIMSNVVEYNVGLGEQRPHYERS